MFPKETLDGCQPTTRYQYRRMITRFSEFIDKPIIEATVADFNAWTELNAWGMPTPTNPNGSTETKKLALNSIKAYLREVLCLEEHPLLQHTFKHRTGQRRKALSLSEKGQALADMARMTRPRILVIRNTAFMKLLWATGVRRHELANLLMADVNLETGYIKVWAKAKKRKGKREQLKKPSPEAMQALKAWLEIRPQFNPNGCPHVFVTQDGSQWKSNSIASFFKRLNKRLDFTIYAHAYRGGFATHALEQGIPDRLVMKAGGWESWQVFQRYTEQVSLDRFAEMMWGSDDI